MASTGRTFTDLTDAQRTVYEDETLMRALPRLYHTRWGKRRPLAEHEGYRVTFATYSAFPVATTKLVEMEVPESETFTLTPVTVTPYRYGSYVYISRQLAEEGIFDILRDASELLGEQAAKTSDRLARTTLVAGGTAQIAGGHSANTSITSSDVLDHEELLKARQTLVKNNALGIAEAGNKFVLIFHPDQGYDLFNDPALREAWLKGGVRGEANPIWAHPVLDYMGIVGYETSEVYISSDGGSSTTDLYYALMLGKQAYGIAGFGALMAEYVEGGTGMEHRPLELWFHGYEDYPPMRNKCSLAWMFSQGEAMLNSNFMIRIETASSIGSN